MITKHLKAMLALKALGMKPAEVLDVIKAATVKVVVVRVSQRVLNGH